MKRGVFFTVTAVLFIAALAVLLSANTTSVVRTDSFSVLEVNAYRERMETVYLPAIVRAQSYDTLQRLSHDADARNRYLVLPLDFANASLNGNYSGIVLPNFKNMRNYTRDLENASRSIGYNLSINVTNTTIIQTGAFTATAEVNFTYVLVSRDQKVRFVRNITVSGEFSLLGLPDLFYNRNSNTWVPADSPHSIAQYRPVAWDNAAFADMANTRRYSTNPDAPSILLRLQGINTAHPYGVESVINQTYIVADDYTSLDWQHANASQFACRYDIAQMPGVRLDIYAVARYNLTGTTLHGTDPTCPPGP